MTIPYPGTHQTPFNSYPDYCQAVWDSMGENPQCNPLERSASTFPLIAFVLLAALIFCAILFVGMWVLKRTSIPHPRDVNYLPNPGPWSQRWMIPTLAVSIVAFGGVVGLW